MENTGNPMGAFVKAVAFAADKHRNQRRKDAEASPYINHPIALANVLANEGGVDDVTVLCAAVLHDTIEDTEATHADLVAAFGQAIADIVAEATDDKSLPKEIRKALQISHAPQVSAAAKQLKLADKISNLRAIADSPPANWNHARRTEYVGWAGRVAAGCKGVNPALDALFDETYRAALARLADDV